MAGSLILSATYGITTKPTDDPYIETAEVAMQAMAATGNAGAYAVDSWPFCMSNEDAFDEISHFTWLL
jgi:hypothetical protein